MTGIKLPTSEQWNQLCREDVEFMRAARHWTGGLRLGMGDDDLVLSLRDGRPGAVRKDLDFVEYRGDPATWRNLLAAVPEPGDTDLMANLASGRGLIRTGSPIIFAQYHAAE